MDEDRRPDPWPGYFPDDAEARSGEVVLALLAPVDDLDPEWLAQIRSAEQPLRILVSYEAPPGAFPYVPRSDQAGFDEAARAMVLLDRAAQGLPASDPSDLGSWAVVGPTELRQALCRVAQGAARVVVSWPPRRGWSGLLLSSRARWLVRRVAKELGRPVHLITLGRVRATR
jgi:hypothetical protein